MATDALILEQRFQPVVTGKLVAVTDIEAAFDTVVNDACSAILVIGRVEVFDPAHILLRRTEQGSRTLCPVLWELFAG